MKLVVLGANGQLGSDILSECFNQGLSVVPLTHEDIEIRDIDSVNKILTEIKPTHIINTTAYHHVPLCEENPDIAFAVNAMGVKNIAQVSNDLNATFVHFSTDYVFDGKKNTPYLESDYCRPLNIYGISKLSGENIALSYSFNAIVIRVSALYGSFTCRAKGSNFITSMIKLANTKDEVSVVNDEIITPTSTRSIAKNTLGLLKKGGSGLFHMTSEGQTSWFEFASEIWKTLNLNAKLVPVSHINFPAKIKRPLYSVLENKNLLEMGANMMPDWKHELNSFLKTSNITA